MHTYFQYMSYAYAFSGMESYLPQIDFRILKDLTQQKFDHSAVFRNHSFIFIKIAMYKIQLVRLQEEQILLCTRLLHTYTDAFGHIISDEYSPFKYWIWTTQLRRYSFPA